jgi:hypothetical protein
MVMLPDRPASDVHVAADVARGVCRLFGQMGFSPVCELILGCGRRADVAGIDAGGRIVIAEVKVSLADLRADGKWPDYVGYCDAFYFAVPPGFPHDPVPEEPGLIVADRYGGAIVRDAPVFALPGARRRATLIRFARTAAGRLHRTADPEGHARGPD